MQKSGLRIVEKPSLIRSMGVYLPIYQAIERLTDLPLDKAVQVPMGRMERYNAVRRAHRVAYLRGLSISCKSDREQVTIWRRM